MPSERVVTILRGEDSVYAHVLGCFRADHLLVHLQVEPTLDLADVTSDDGRYWANLSGRHLLHFLATQCGDCWANGATEVSLRYAVEGGRFLGWR